MFRACLLGALLLLISSTLPASEKKAPFQVPTPPHWRTETIPLPPSFAPEMKWKGTEELRFSPGMFKANSADFFSYTMLFWLPGDAEVDAKSMERELLAYYRGLSAAVSKSKKQTVDTKAFTVTISPAKQPDNRPGGEVVTAYVGELNWTEPFATQKPLTARLEIHVWPSAKDKHQCVFVCASAQPETAAVWRVLREIRAGCR